MIKCERYFYFGDGNDMSENSTKPINLKCRVCGGEIRNDYLSATCVCANCGNKWPMQEMLPDYQTHASAVEKIKQARCLMEEKPDVTKISQAKLLLHQASTECLHPDPVSAELLKTCKDGIKETDDLRHYAVAVSHMDKKNYRQALSELERIPNFRDSSKLIEDCKDRHRDRPCHSDRYRSPSLREDTCPDLGDHSDLPRTCGWLLVCSLS